MPRLHDFSFFFFGARLKSQEMDKFWRLGFFVYSSPRRYLHVCTNMDFSDTCTRIPESICIEDNGKLRIVVNKPPNSSVIAVYLTVCSARPASGLNNTNMRKMKPTLRV